MGRVENRGHPPEQVDLKSCIEGDEEARDRFVKKYLGLIRYAVQSVLAHKGRLPTREGVEELCHDVLVALFDDNAKKLRQFQGRNGCTVATWLRVVATRLVIDRLRRERSIVFVSNAVAETTGPGGITPEEVLVRTESLQRIKQAISVLPPKDQLLIELYFTRDMRLEEVAEILGISANTVSVRKSRILEKVKKALTPET